MEIREIEEMIKKLYPAHSPKKLLEGGMSYAYEVAGKIIRIPKTEYAENGYVCEKAILDYLHTIVSCTKLPDIQIIREPFFYTIHDKINGIYWNERDYLGKTEKIRDGLAEDCAVFFSQLHSAKIEEIKAQLLDLHPIKNNMETYLKNYFSCQEMEQILKFTDPLFDLPKDQLVLVHRDFYSDNFLLTDNYRLHGVLDFGNSGIYNYMFEFKALASWEEGMKDLFERIASRYTKITGRDIDMETIHRIDIHNYISFLVYFEKNKNIKDEKIGAANCMQKHVNHIKEKMQRYV